MITGLSTYIRIGSIEVQRVPELRILSERGQILTRTSITLPDPTGNIFRRLKDRDPVSVILGYRGQTPALWEGTVLGKSVGRNKDQLVIKSVGPERPLSETIIKQTFYKESPDAIVRYAVEQAGLEPGRIEPVNFIIPRFVASSIPAWQVARQCEHTCHKAHGIDMRGWALWMGKDWKVNWGPFDEVADIPVIDSNANLIRHSPGNNHSELSRIETFMLPHMMHSMQFRLKDHKRGVNGDFRAIKAEHILKHSQARTMISYGEDHERH